MLRVALSFDYDSPAGYRQSFHMRDFPANADQQGSELLLDVMEKHRVRATFGIVGLAATDGEPPDHCSDQIREIASRGHEIASHSMTHVYLPSLRTDALYQELEWSKKVLQDCVGRPITGFIPPFNRPMHFPRAGAVSLSEMIGTAGRGRGRQSIESLLRALNRSGFRWSRVSFSSKLAPLVRLFQRRQPAIPTQPFLLHDVVAIPLHCAGFGAAALSLVRRLSGRDLVLTLYGHPNQALSANDQNARVLDRFLREIEPERERGQISLNTMTEIDEGVRSGGSPPAPDNGGAL